jgi:hypothetical protein
VTTVILSTGSNRDLDVSCGWCVTMAIWSSNRGAIAAFA